MPRFIITPHAHPPKHERLLKKLVQELKTPSTNVQPLILEERIPSTKSRHVRVVWDGWKELGDEQRSTVITEAYAEAEGREAAEEITIAEGLTPPEALALGLLPFKVVPARKKNDTISEEAYQKALASEGAIPYSAPGPGSCASPESRMPRKLPRDSRSAARIVVGSGPGIGDGVVAESVTPATWQLYSS